MRKESNYFTLGDLVVERESNWPYFWIVTRKGIQLDRDQYSNDIRERYEMGIYSDNSLKK
jgi:hypothetical protein